MARYTSRKNNKSNINIKNRKSGKGKIAMAMVAIITAILCLVMVLVPKINTAASSYSSEVESYDSVIREYAQEYDMTEYVNLIKAVMMQESKGKGLDPMQASESSYNTEYEQVANGITDPSYSIACGIQYLKDSLELAGVTGADDMTSIKLAIQGYNFGHGYITWALERDGGYTVENASLFSDQMAAEMNWDRYGDKEYVTHVLRYYNYTA